MVFATIFMSHALRIQYYEIMVILERKKVNFVSFLPRAAGTDVPIQCMSATIYCIYTVYTRLRTSDHPLTNY